MKGTTGIGLYGAQQRRRRPFYTAGLRVVKLRRHKDTRAAVCNILKPGEINYPGALMNYELCLRSRRRTEIFFGVRRASPDSSFSPLWTPHILLNHHSELKHHQFLIRTIIRKN